MNRRSEKKEILVWDRATRVFHWTLVAMVAVGWLTSEAEGAWFWSHLAAGYAILALVFFRLAWGVLGGRHARFGDFVRGWAAAREQFRALLALRPPRHIGHNPLGGWMILALLAGLTAVVVTGLFAGDDGDLGPYASLLSPRFADAVSEVHEALSSVLLALIGLHVAGVVVDSLLGRENLVRAMWTGVKRVAIAEPEGDAAEPAAWRLAMALVVVAAALATVIAAAPG